MTKLLEIIRYPAFWDGVARVVDLGGTLTRYQYRDDARTPEQQDFDAFASDWQTVGQDLRSAINSVAAEPVKTP